MGGRSRAIQIGMNLSVLEEWVVNSGLPHGVEGHFTPVRELVHWLQVCDGHFCLSGWNVRRAVKTRVGLSVLMCCTDVLFVIW